MKKILAFICNRRRVDNRHRRQSSLTKLRANFNAPLPKVPRHGDTAAAFSSRGNDSPAPQQATPLDPAAATQAWLDSVPKDKREKSDAYFEGGYWLILWDYLVAAGISILLLSSRISARLRDSSERLTNSKTLQVACYSVLYLLLVYVLSFPLNLYEHFFREHQYGLATQTFPAWFREQLIGLGITIIGGTIFFVDAVCGVPPSAADMVDLGNWSSPLFSRLFCSLSRRYSLSRFSTRINR